MPLPKLEDWKAPWEVDANGADIPEENQTLDPARLKKHLHNLLGDKERLQANVTTVTAERDDFKSKLDEAARANEGDEERRKREQQEAIDAAKAEGSLNALKLEVALDIDGITGKQAKALAKRLSGSTREELAEDAKTTIEDLGLQIGKPAAPEGDEGDDEGKPSPASRPRRQTASGDPRPNERSLPDPTDPVAMAKAFPTGI